MVTRLRRVHQPARPLRSLALTLLALGQPLDEVVLAAPEALKVEEGGTGTCTGRRGRRARLAGAAAPMVACAAHRPCPFALRQRRCAGLQGRGKAR